jgi:hypothetical protein
MKANPPVDESEGSEDFYKYMREPAIKLSEMPSSWDYQSLESEFLEGLPTVLARRLLFAERIYFILSLMFQFKRLGIKPLCGTCPVIVSDIESIDVAYLIAERQDCCLVAGDVLKRVRH